MICFRQQKINSSFKKGLFCLKKQRAFTLIELILVVAVIALIASVVIVAINPNRRIGEVNDSRRWTDITAIAKAIELYTADNGFLPSEFSTSTVSVGDKVVLCSSSATLTCDDQTRGCLVVSNANFLGVYLPALPVDPLKDAVSDTGYYLTRNANDTISIGACNAYNNHGLQTVAKVELPTYLPICGDGRKEGNEVCDPPVNAGYCGDGIVQSGNFCNSNCSGYTTRSEVCDHTAPALCVNGGHTWHESTRSFYFCRLDCLEEVAVCEF